MIYFLFEEKHIMLEAYFSISRVEPDKVQKTSASYLNIELENLPSLGGQLACVFDFGTLGSLSTLAQPNGGLDNRIRLVTIV